VELKHAENLRVSLYFAQKPIRLVAFFSFRQHVSRDLFANKILTCGSGGNGVNPWRAKLLGACKFYPMTVPWSKTRGRFCNSNSVVVDRAACYSELRPHPRLLFLVHEVSFFVAVFLVLRVF